MGKEVLQSPTDPEVLLDDDRRNATPRAGFVKEAGATASVKACDAVHYGTSTSLRRTGRIHADAYVAPRAS